MWGAWVRLPPGRTRLKWYLLPHASRFPLSLSLKGKKKVSSTNNTKLNQAIERLAGCPSFDRVLADAREGGYEGTPERLAHEVVAYLVPQAGWDLDSVIDAPSEAARDFYACTNYYVENGDYVEY